MNLARLLARARLRYSSTRFIVVIVSPSATMRYFGRRACGERLARSGQLVKLVPAAAGVAVEGGGIEQRDGGGEVRPRRLSQVGAADEERVLVQAHEVLPRRAQDQLRLIAGDPHAPTIALLLQQRAIGLVAAGALRAS